MDPLLQAFGVQPGIQNLQRRICNPQLQCSLHCRLTMSTTKRGEIKYYADGFKNGPGALKTNKLGQAGHKNNNLSSQV